MSTQVMIFLVALMICLMIIIKWVLNYITDEKRLKADKSTEYWKGRYYALATVLDNLTKCEISDEMLEEIEKIIPRNS